MSSEIDWPPICEDAISRQKQPVPHYPGASLRAEQLAEERNYDYVLCNSESTTLCVAVDSQGRVPITADGAVVDRIPLGMAHADRVVSIQVDSVEGKSTWTVCGECIR